MTNITESDVISYLKDRVASLKQELKKAVDGLAFFSSIGSTVPNGNKGVRRGRKPKSIVGALSDTIEQTIQSIHSVKAVAIPRKQLSIPDVFSAELTRDRQIVYVLSKTPDLSSAGVAKEIASLLSVQTEAKLDRNILQRLSALKNLGQIKARKKGRISHYSL